MSHAGPVNLRMPFHPYNPGELEREVEQAGLRLSALTYHPAPPPGRIGSWARPAAAYVYAAIQVPRQ